MRRGTHISKAGWVSTLVNEGVFKLVKWASALVMVDVLILLKWVFRLVRLALISVSEG